MPFTMSLASAAGDHLPAGPDAVLAWASISVLTLDSLLFCGRRNIAANRQFACLLQRRRKQTDHLIPRQHTSGGCRAVRFAGTGEHAGMKKQAAAKRKGLQLALEPLNGQGIAGYVPKPELWARSRKTAPRENSHVVSALGVLGDVEAFTLGLDIGAQANDHVDDLVEDRRTDARPHQRGADAPELGDHLRGEVVIGNLRRDRGVVNHAGATESR